MCERVPDITREQAKLTIEEKVTNGEVMLDIDEHRYIRNGELFFPCTKWKRPDEQEYLVKSVLTWDMVDYRIQRAIDLHTKKKSQIR